MCGGEPTSSQGGPGVQHLFHFDIPCAAVTSRRTCNEANHRCRTALSMAPQGPARLGRADGQRAHLTPSCCRDVETRPGRSLPRDEGCTASRASESSCLPMTKAKFDDILGSLANDSRSCNGHAQTEDMTPDGTPSPHTPWVRLLSAVATPCGFPGSERPRSVPESIAPPASAFWSEPWSHRQKDQGSPLCPRSCLVGF